MSNENKQAISFSIELTTRNQIKRVSLPDGSGDKLMVEGYLGELTEIALVEDILLKIKGTCGVLRIELSRKELENALKGKKKRR